MSKRKAEAGVEAPKRPQSGYGQFFAEKRSEISSTLLKEGLEAKTIMTASAKRAGEMWKALGAAKQAPYNAKSEKLVLAWTKELDAFKTANPDFQKVKKVKKGDKNDKPPTRPPGAYGMWLGDNRTMLTEKVMKEHKVDKSKAFFLLYKEGKAVYDALPAAEKKQCEEKAEAAKVKWQLENKEWKENTKGKENDIPSKSKGGDKGPKRPLGAYPQWIGDNRAMLTEKVMKQHSVDKAKAFLMLYKEGKAVYDALPAAEKKKCEDQATAAKVKFQADCKVWKENNKGGKAPTIMEMIEEGEEDEKDDQNEE